jgi:hypothetical protein
MRIDVDHADHLIADMPAQSTMTAVCGLMPAPYHQQAIHRV